MNDEFFAAPTSEASAPVWELSGWWRRVGAYVIDWMLIGLPMMFLPELLALDSPSTGEAIAFEGSWFLITLVATAIYFMWTMSAWNGQTVGKKVTDIRVVRENGEPVTAGYAFVRQTLVIGILFGYVALLLLYVPTLLNYLWPLWDEKNQAFHDMIVDSRVVRAREVSNPGIAIPPAQPVSPDQPFYGFTPPFPQAPVAQPPVPQPPTPLVPAPPAPPVPGGTSTPYAPPSGFENPVPDEEK